jgi:hypothetical protein
MTVEQQHIDTGAIRESVDLVELASRYTRLTQVSRRGEYAGPCPACGGDAIDLVQLVHGVGFREACRLLTEQKVLSSERPPVTVPTTPVAEQDHPSWQSRAYQESAHRTLWATRRKLMGSEGAVGRAYLRQRGLDEATWDTYRLGFGHAYHPTRREQRDAIFLPWFGPDGKTITAIQHRFIDPDLGKGQRYCHKPGSEPLLFGLQALGSGDAGHENRPETLCIVEGEFNCMSLHQSGVAALSVGSEANAGSDRTLAMLQNHALGYERLLVWCDDPTRAEQMAARLAAGGPFREEHTRVVSSLYDANELLVAGELAPFLDTLLDDMR